MSSSYNFCCFEFFWQQEANREPHRGRPCVASCGWCLLCQTTPRAARSCCSPPPEDTVAIKQRCRKLRSRVCSRRVSESPSLSASLCCRQIRPAAPATVFPEKRHCFPGPRVEGRLKIISGGAIRNVSGQQSIHYGSLLNRSPGSLQGAIKVTQPLSPPRASRANLAFEDEFIGCV